MHKRIGMVLAATMALTSVSASFAPASAMPAAPSVNTAVQSGGQIEQVRDGDRRWRRGSHNNSSFYRHNRGRDNYYSHRRHRGGSFGPGLALGLGLGFGVGSAYGYNNYYDGYNGYYAPAPRYYAPRYRTYSAYNGGGYRQACASRYRSYDWRSNTYLGYDGLRHVCRL